MAPTAFGDFGKTVTDLFKKSKYELKRTLKIKAKDSGTEWTSESSFPVESGGKVSTKSTYKQSDKKYGAVEIEVVGSGKNPKFDYEVPKMVDGLKNNFVVEYPNVTAKAKYSQDKILGKASVKVNSENTQNVVVKTEVATVVQDGLYLGGEFSYNASNSSMGYAVGAHYMKGETQLTLKTHDMFNKVGVQLHKKVSDDGEVAADYLMNLNDYNPTCTVGGKYKLDDKSTVQGCVKSDGNVFLLYNHKFSSRLAGSLGTTFNVQKPDDMNTHYKFELTV